MTGLGQILAFNNACLNATSAVCIMLGYRAIKAGKRDTHRKFMMAALSASALFLVSYLTRIAMFGDTKFQGQGWIRPVYFFILITHVILAITVVPLVLRAAFLAIKSRFDAHKRIARVAFPIWLYVSVTGVVVYLMLYQWPV